VVLWEDEVVYKIILGLSYDLTVGELVEKFGAPEAIDVGEGGIPEHPYWDVVLYYPGLGMRFLARAPWESHRLESTNEVTLSTYFVPTSIEELLEDMYGSDEKSRERTRSWKGYGDLFQIYYESPEDVFRGK